MEKCLFGPCVNLRNFSKFLRVSLTPSGLASVLCRLLFLYLKAKSHRIGHSYCSSQGCERVKIQATTDSKAISNCMAKAYPQYYKKPSALKRMPSMLTGLCQGCGTQQVNKEEKWAIAREEKSKDIFAISTFFFETSVLPIYKYCMLFS